MTIKYLTLQTFYSVWALVIKNTVSNHFDFHLFKGGLLLILIGLANTNMKFDKSNKIFQSEAFHPWSHLEDRRQYTWGKEVVWW